MVFQSLEESAKCRQKISCGQTDELKCLAYRHILKPVVKVLYFVFRKLYSSSLDYMQSAALIPPDDSHRQPNSDSAQLAEH